MSSTGLAIFDTTIQETNALLKEIEIALRWEGKRRESYDAVRGVLQTLRDRLTIEETAHFAAQLPMLLRGVFYEGWNPAIVPVKMGKVEFLQHVVEKGNISDSEQIEPIVHVIIEALKNYVSAGEMDDVRAILPEDIASLLE